MKDHEANRIAPLGELDDFRVADGEPDVRGWDVVSADGRKLGKVDELIVDTSAMKVRYLVVDLDREIAKDRKVVVPIGSSRLDDDRDRVLISGIDASRLASLPAYERGRFGREYESSLLPHFGRGARTGAAGATSAAATGDRDRFYESEHFDNSRFYGEQRGRAFTDDETRVTRSEEELAIGKRQVRVGEVALRKTVETEHVSQPVERMREEVTVERRPVDAAHATADIGEDEIRVPVMEEEVVVDKRPVVKEEVVVKKHAVRDTEDVEADLRRERVDLDDSSIRNRSAAGTADVDDAGRTRGGRGRGAGKRLADAADDVKDRVDGNPASRPGPDATDARR